MEDGYTMSLDWYANPLDPPHKWALLFQLFCVTFFGHYFFAHFELSGSVLLLRINFPCIQNLRKD